MREIEIKKELRIRINDSIISYKSIEKIFKNVFECNMFNSDIKITVGKDYLNFNSIQLNCFINKEKSADILLNKLPLYFNDYTITKWKNEKFIVLEAILFESRKCDCSFKKFSETEKNKHKEDDWFSIFIKDREINLKEIEPLINNSFVIKSISIDNFKKFIFNFDKKYELDYLDLENYILAK